jgi:hypothetical protein
LPLVVDELILVFKLDAFGRTWSILDLVVFLLLLSLCFSASSCGCRIFLVAHIFVDVFWLDESIGPDEGRFVSLILNCRTAINNNILA